ncbi:MAG: cysteine desulfurase family protein [Chloroflexota bacterium]
MKKRIYLDYCATTPIHPRVIEKILITLNSDFGNPSSIHWAGFSAKQILDNARLEVATNINCHPEEIIFTSGATEADNLALFGTMRLFPPHKAHLITSSIEHHAILHTAETLEREGYSVTYLPVDQYGFVDADDVLQAIRPETKLISIMYVNNEVGSIQPIKEIGFIAKENSIRFHTDAVQAIGMCDVNVDDLYVDMLSISAHKIYGPKGIGALYLRSGLELTPLIVGGPQERWLRAGTENVVGIAGFGEAINLVSQHRQEERVRQIKMRKYLTEGLRTIYPKVIINEKEGHVVPHIISVSFLGADAEMLLVRLNGEGIAVSMGSACSSESLEPSHVLTAMNLSHEHIESTLRVSIGMMTTIEELDSFLQAISRVLPKALIS